MPVTEAKGVEVPPADSFARRHLGPSPKETAEMLKLLGYDSLEKLADAAVPADIRLKRLLHLPDPLLEHEALTELKAIASHNHVWRSYLGLGYQESVTPPPKRQRQEQRQKPSQPPGSQRRRRPRR